MKNIVFYGNFKTVNGVATHGQTSKSLNFYNISKRCFANHNVTNFDTSTFKRHFLRDYLRLCNTLKKTDLLVIFPGSISSLKIVLRAARKGKNITIYYPIVGGWLADRIKNKKRIIRYLSNVKTFYPETFGLQKQLNDLGILNTKVLPVFTTRKRVSFDSILSNYNNKKHDLNYKFVYFGRISIKKGIMLAIDAIKQLNTEFGFCCSLDFYGATQDDEDLSDFFASLNNYINYHGVLPDDDIAIIGDYDFFLFPTFYEGEGFPATCVESFTYGTPIIASNWRYNSEIIKEGINGFLFDLQKNNLADVILNIFKQKYDIIELKKKAYDCGLQYLPEIAIKPFIDDMKEELKDE